MVKNKKVIWLISILLLLGIAVGVGSQIVIGKEFFTQTADMEIDYTNIDTLVDEILKEMPEISSKIDEIRKDTTAENVSYSIKDTLDVQKTKFRFLVENKLFKLSSNDAEITAEAEKFTKNYQDALEIADKNYGISITQEEVTKYIDEKVSVFVNEEKELYAKALGLTLDELDYGFDRDFYVMDTLWEKMIPVLMEKYPRETEEDDNDHFERIKEKFYSEK